MTWLKDLLAIILNWLRSLSEPVPEPLPPPTPEPPPTPDAIDIKTCHWPSIEARVKTWPITARLEVVMIDTQARTIYYRYSGHVWKDSNGVNGNIHIGKGINGVPEFGTWDWMKTGVFETTRHLDDYDRLSIIGKYTHNSALQKRRLRKGDTVWFMVSGLCRGTDKGSEERSNIVEVKWP